MRTTADIFLQLFQVCMDASGNPILFMLQNIEGNYCNKILVYCNCDSFVLHFI